MADLMAAACTCERVWRGYSQRPPCPVPGHETAPPGAEGSTP